MLARTGRILIKELSMLKGGKGEMAKMEIPVPFETGEI